MKTKLTEKELSVISSNNGLQRYLESLLKGRNATPRSWLYEQISPEEVLDNWKQKLSALENGSKPEQEVFQFDTSQEAKWGPQGEVKPISDLMEIVEQGFESSPTPKAFSDKLWALAKQRVTDELFAQGVQKLRPASYKHVIDDMRARDTLESNSGWPLFTRRNKPEVVESSIADAESGIWKEYPAIALFRNYNLKTRLVWMFPMSANLVEGSYFQVLQSAMMKRGIEFFAPWTGFESVRASITNQYDKGRFVMASDFSSTDAHFHLAATMEVCDVIEQCFQQPYRVGLRDSLTHMHKIPLVISPTDQMTGDHGVSSGSNWTNFVETIFDWILAEYVSLKRRGIAGLYAIGDDMTWQTARFDEQFPAFLERVGKAAGQEIKADKTTNDQDKVKTLQRLFLRGYKRPDGMERGIYSTIRALKSSVYPERFHDPRKWSSDMFCARQYMILENCVDHPLFEEFVKFVVLGQKDLIPFAHQSAAQLQRILRKTKLLPGLNPTYNQEKRDHSFAEFASIRIAANL